MKSIQTKIGIVITGIMLFASAAFMITSMVRNKTILEEDSNKILLSSADYYANVMDDNFKSAEQSVGSIYNYAMKRAETYTAFLKNEAERDAYTNDISELGKSIAENTRGAMAVYLRYNPEDYGATNGFWYTINLSDGSWQSSVPTDMSLYEKDDIEHVGWYYIPVEAGIPIWMDPYFNKNLGVEMISYIIPYYYEDYTVGIMGMDIDMSVLREAVSTISVYESGKAFLITKEGNIIYHEKYVDGIDFEELPTGDQEYFRNILSLDKDTININQSMSGESEKLILKELRNGMILGVYVPEEVIEIPQKVLFRQLFLISFVIFILAILFCLVWVRTIIRPLKKMTDVAEHYAGGNFDEEMSVNSDDEVGKLSRSLQTMSTSLKQQIEIANSANRTKSDFLANMSHEIRTPINAVLGMNEMILRETGDDNIKNYAYDIHIAGQTLLSIINDILDMSKIESGKMEIIPVEYDSANLINDVINMAAVKMENKNLSFQTEIDEVIPSRLFGDDIRLRQILFNLLTNAIKYTREGTITLTIKCESEGDQAKLYFSVRDTGMGIAKEDIEKLFQAFVRIDENNTRNIEGTGLGLNIVSMLLRLMDSEIKIESEYGKGSDFYFTLYQRVVDPTPIGNLKRHEEECVREYTHETRYLIPDVKVLVVDDNAMNRKVFVKLLEDLQCEIDQADSGLECLKRINDKKYDVIFMDHMMPVMDGIETLHKIREMKDGKNLATPVIALTANAVVGAKEMYLKEGFDNFLSKPISPDKLESMLLHSVPDYKVFSSDLYLPAEPETEAGRTSEDSEKNASGDFKKSASGDYKKSASEDYKKNVSEDYKKSASEKGWDSEELPDVEGADFKYALQKLKNVELLLSIIEDFSVTADHDLEVLRDMYQRISSEEPVEEALKAFRIQVHAMKNTAAMTGAIQASALARVLEYAARDGEIATIHACMGVFEQEWKKMKVAYDTAFGFAQEPDKSMGQQMDPELLKEKLETLSDAMDILDTDIADAVMDELAGYQYPEKEEQIRKELVVAVRNLDIAESQKLIKEWMSI